MPKLPSNEHLESKPRRHLQFLAQRFAEFPSVTAVVLAGLRAGGKSDPESDFDIYVYAHADVPVEFRRALLGQGAEITIVFGRREMNREPSPPVCNLTSCTALPSGSKTNLTGSS